MIEVLFDTTRLVLRASAEVSTTGIDRVTEAYGRWLLSREDVRLIPVCTWGGIASPITRRAFAELLEARRRAPALSDAAWRGLTAALAASTPLGDAMRAPSRSASRGRRIVRYASAAAYFACAYRPAPHRPGAVYLNVSHYGLEQSGVLRRLATCGVRPMAMLHDLIPIAHPEYCSPAASPWHRRRVDQLLEHADIVITNSRATADELAAFASAGRRRAPRVCVVPLGLEPRFIGGSDPLPAAGRYFLCVGTLEPRKNLPLLFHIWRRLAERYGDRTPPLVLAGSRGWESEAIIDHLERSPPVRRHVHEVAGLSDDQLVALMRGAVALLSPSFTEGFNLPVAEALALGTPVIASNIAAHRELAGAAHLIDASDGPAWLSAIEAVLERRPPRPAYTPTSWPAHFAKVAEIIGLDRV
jgi:glycosyltransferase involved in cell wall biosynthesis